MKETCPYCNPKFKDKPRSEEDVKKLKNRINRVVGQLNGISKMIDDNRYCGDILIQLSAAEKALEQLNYMILKNHLETCVVSKIQNNNLDVIDETIELIQKIK